MTSPKDARDALAKAVAAQKAQRDAASQVAEEIRAERQSGVDGAADTAKSGARS